MENGLLLTFPQSQTPVTTTSNCCSIFVPHLQFLQLKTTSHFHFITSHNHHHLSLSFTLAPKFGKWDCNANRNFNFSFDEDKEENEEEEEEEEEEEDDDDDDDDDESFSGNVKKIKKKRKWWSKKRPPKLNRNRAAFVFDQAIESIFIFKVFKSFGWFLPVVIISFLLATGFKAFLMTLALYLALSLLFLAFEKLWGMMKQKPIRKARMRRRKASSMKASRVQVEDGEGEEVQDTRTTRMDNPYRVGSDNGPVRKGIKDLPDFGGWDFLDGARPVQETSRVINDSQRTMEEEKLSGNGRRVTSKSQRTRDEKLSGNGRRSDTPLLLRLLIALFPFIGLWVKMFW